MAETDRMAVFLLHAFYLILCGSECVSATDSAYHTDFYIIVARYIDMTIGALNQKRQDFIEHLKTTA